jgi:putative endopeptidase
MNKRPSILQTSQKGIQLFGVFLFFTSALHAQQGTPGKTTVFIDKANMDLTVKPGDDFYEYANGTWLKNNPVPPKETRWGSFFQLHEFNSMALKKILEEASAKKTGADSIEKRVGDFYASGMDSITIEKEGYKPIQSDLKRILAIKDLKGILNEAATLRTSGAGNPLFGFAVDQDRKNAESMVPQLSQGGTTLPDRDYYLKSDPRSLKIQEAYKTYIIALFKLTGSNETSAAKNAETIFAIEKKMAESQLPRVDMRDPYKTYNKFAVSDFSKTTPNIDWKTLLVEMKAPAQDTVIVNNPKFFTDLNSLVAGTPLADWKIYLQWSVIKTASPYLSSAFVNASFDFNKALSGQKVQTPRWERMSGLTDRSIGDLLGQLYVAKYFNPQSKARMDEMIKNLVKAYEIRIKALDWMSEATKTKALDKLSGFTPKIGYPEQWKTYKGLVINRNTFLQNVRHAGEWNYADMVSQLGKPVDRKRFGMTPPTVNAYYSAQLNEIVFPAGILQFPFFDPNADDAVNYGGIGAVIGHEISHGFDDSGSKYDKNGNLLNWWTEEDLSRFKAKAKTLQEQFDTYTVLDTIHVNGKLTMGENIGDLGGLNAAYQAFKMTKQGMSTELIDGFTPDQRFFLAFAQVWRVNVLPETAAQLILTDNHSPGAYRAIGAAVNMDAWYLAFDVKPGDKLYKRPENRIRIW